MSHTINLKTHDLKVIIVCNSMYYIFLKVNKITLYVIFILTIAFYITNKTQGGKQLISRWNKIKTTLQKVKRTRELSIN